MNWMDEWKRQVLREEGWDKAVRMEKNEKWENESQLESEESNEKPIMVVSEMIDENEAENEKDFILNEPKRRKKTETVPVDFPRNPWKNPETTAMMDRLKLTPSQAMGFLPHSAPSWILSYAEIRQVQSCKMKP